MTADFTRTGYGMLLQGFLDRGYQVRGFDTAEPGARHLILRHDLDMSLQAAIPIAEIEAGLGVRACFFVLVRTEMYNPFASVDRQAIQKLAALGHEIGLHLDAGYYGEDADALESGARAECSALESLADVRVRAISLHRPAPSLLSLDRPLAGRLHAYHPRFFRDMGYCSDSRGHWGHGHPFANPAVAEGRALQLLTHPIWWFRDVPMPVQENLESFALDRYHELRQELGRNCSTFDPCAPSAVRRADSG